jgi:copper/silver efflux system protein
MSSSETEPRGSSPKSAGAAPRGSLLGALIRFCLQNKLIVLLLMLVVIGWGIMVAPFDWDLGGLPRGPVPVDAIPDIGENQQIVFTEWMGRSPQDVEDQISYPLTVSLLGIPGVKTIRSFSMFGFSSIYIIFDEDIEFYWSRSRVLEKLNSLPAGTLPDEVQPALGPDATALGQVYWYTLEGRDPDGKPAGGWDLHELRTAQDWYVRYGLLAAEGISEVASIGGFVQEYQIDVDPDAMRAARVNLHEIYNAVRGSNLDVGARTIEMNQVEYVVRGIGFVKTLQDLETTVVQVNDNVPIYIKDIGKVTLGPALRRGVLDKEGAEAVGGVVVVRYGFNPLEAIKNVKEKIEEISPGLPAKAVVDFRRVTTGEVREFTQREGFPGLRGHEIDQDEWLRWLRNTPREQWPEWATISQVTVVPFYDRTGLIYETLGTLSTALIQQILVTVIVVLVTLMHLRSSLLISALLPLAVLMCFIAMKTFGVDANIVALSGIAIAIGTIVDMGIILNENILKHLEEADPEEDRLEVILRASTEVGSAVLTAIATTVISFLPVFTMIGAEGKLFRPLAFTKTFVLLASVTVALTIIPPMAHLLLARKVPTLRLRQAGYITLILLGIAAWIWLAWWVGAILVALGMLRLAEGSLPERLRGFGPTVASGAAVLLVGMLLTGNWLPLGPELGFLRNFIFVAVLIGGLLFFFQAFQRWFYTPMLTWALDHKLIFLSLPALIVLLGAGAWLGPATVFGPIPQEYDAQSLSEERVEDLSLLQRYQYRLGGLRQRSWHGDIAYASIITKLEWMLADSWDGLGKEFMPPLDEGSFLWMPTTMPHASIGEALDVLQVQDRRIASIPEVDLVVGKLGRVESPLDPAPVSMIETVISYHPEYLSDQQGRRLNFRYDDERGEFARDEAGDLIPDASGRPYRLWREHIRTPDDIWREIVQAAEIPGTTSAPKLQPIAARIVMLQSGMRAPMGVKIRGPDLETIERFALEIERLLKEVPSVEPSAVFADRIVGKPYLEIEIDREAIARYGLQIQQVQDVIEVAIGGRRITSTVEGRERYPVRVRYFRELRDSAETLGRILVAGPDGAQIPLEQLADIRYVRGPQAIKSEDTFLIGYVLFDMKPGSAEVDVVEACQRHLQEKIDSGELTIPVGVSYTFAGSYENQVRSQKTLMIVLPLALFIIFMILYLQFKDTVTSALVFSGIIVAWAGGFLMIWLYGQPWFLDFEVFGTSMRTLFQVQTINLSVAVWVGFLALFGIATDDGVVITTYLDQSFRRRHITSIEEARRATIEAGQRRVRPCLMTTATTILALLPVLTSTGRGSDIMVPMAIPSFGGMVIAIITMLVVPVLYCAVKEVKLRAGIHDALFAEGSRS